MLDLLWNVDAPFKATMTVLVFTCLVIAVASAAAPPPASYAWFTMGMFVFAGTYYGIVMLIQERLAFYVEVARDGNAKQSIKFLKTGCYIFFAIWILYPIFWVLSDKATGLVSKDLDHVITAVLDVFAKSAYGFALLYFRIYFDKKLEQSGVDVEGACGLTVACCRARSLRMRCLHVVRGHGSKKTCLLRGRTDLSPCADFKKFSEQSIYTPRKKSSSDQDNFDRPRINEYQDRRDRDYDYQDRRDRDYDYQERRDRDYDYQDRERRGHGPGGYDRGVPASDYGDARNNYHDEESGFRGERAGDHGDLATKIRKSLDRRGGRENGMGDSFRRDPASPSRLSMKLSTAGDTRDHLRSGGPTPPRLEMGALGTSFSSRPNSRTGSRRNIDDGLPQRNSSTRSSRESTPDIGGFGHVEYQVPRDARRDNQDNV